MEHVYACAWDAPFDAVSIRFKFTPGYPSTGPSFNDAGEPGEPDDVEVQSVMVTVRGKQRLAEPDVADVFADLLIDDLIAIAREDIAEARAYRGREAA
jgi:hypothetical protein